MSVSVGLQPPWEGQLDNLESPCFLKGPVFDYPVDKVS